MSLVNRRKAEMKFALWWFLVENVVRLHCCLVAPVLVLTARSVQTGLCGDVRPPDVSHTHGICLFLSVDKFPGDPAVGWWGRMIQCFHSSLAENCRAARKSAIEAAGHTPERSLSPLRGK